MFVPKSCCCLAGWRRTVFTVSSPHRWGRCPERHCSREHMEDILCSKWMEWDSDCEENQSSLPSAHHTLLFGGINCVLWAFDAAECSLLALHSVTLIASKFSDGGACSLADVLIFPLYPFYKTKGKLAQLWWVPGRCTVGASEVHRAVLWERPHCVTDLPRLPPELLVCKAQTLHSAAALHWSCSQSLAPHLCSPRSPPFLFVAHGFEHSGFLGVAFVPVVCSRFPDELV